jgi:hypothetical protein
MGVVDKKGVGIILITGVGLHVLSMNVLIPGRSRPLKIQLMLC